jgi:alpha-galactosidase
VRALRPDPEFIALHGAGCTAIWELCAGEAPLWRYWGPRLPDGVTPGAPLRAGRPEPSFSLHHDQPLSVFPTFGVGWFGQSALLAHRDGCDYAHNITHCRVERLDAQTVHFHLTDDVAALEVMVKLWLDPASDVLSLSTTLTNTGDTTIDVQWLAAGTVPLPQDARCVRSYSGRHNAEFIVQEEALSRSLWRRENRRGLTSHDNFPGAVVVADAAAYGAQLAWSGNHAQSIEWLDDGRYAWTMGEWLAPGEVRLQPGAAISTPAMLATCSTDGPNGVAQNFHAAMRQHITWPGGTMKPRPVHLNTWEGFYFDHDEAALKELATSAAEIGIERFVLDDGWFHGRHDDTSSLGDWWADTQKYPNGLLPLATHVTSLGMEFGLWVEPEMINPDSELYRAHPDWALQIAGRPQLAARNQLVLDLTRAEVVEYLYAKIAALLGTLPIRYLKWDHNRDLTTAGARPVYRLQVQAAYALMARIRTVFPDVEIEACAGGGGRIDAGILAHCHRFWTSDCIDAVSRVVMQRGFLQFMPPELMGAHVGTAPAHSTGRSQSMDFRASVALPGHFGVELDVRKISGAERAVLKQWIATYKIHRTILHQGQLWLGEAGDGLVWQAHGSAEALLLLLYRITPNAQRHMPTLKLTMLDPARRYRINDAEIVDGAWLAASGLAIAPMKAEQCQVYTITGL